MLFIYKFKWEPLPVIGRMIETSLSVYRSRRIRFKQALNLIYECCTVNCGSLRVYRFKSKERSEREGIILFKKLFFYIIYSKLLSVGRVYVKACWKSAIPDLDNDYNIIQLVYSSYVYIPQFEVGRVSLEIIFFCLTRARFIRTKTVCAFFHRDRCASRDLCDCRFTKNVGISKCMK